jgi:hypothetical protein
MNTNADADNDGAALVEVNGGGDDANVECDTDDNGDLDVGQPQDGWCQKMHSAASPDRVFHDADESDNFEDEFFGFNWERRSESSGSDDRGDPGCKSGGLDKDLLIADFGDDADIECDTDDDGDLDDVRCQKMHSAAFLDQGADNADESDDPEDEFLGLEWESKSERNGRDPGDRQGLDIESRCLDKDVLMADFPDEGDGQEPWVRQKAVAKVSFYPFPCWVP